MQQDELNSGATCWTTDQNWTYETYSLDTSSQTFGPFASIVDLWRSRGSDGIPDWNKFQLMDFEGWWGWIIVYDVVDIEPPSFKVRLWGREFVKHLGYDLTGQLLTMGDAEPKTDAKHITANDLLFNRHLLDDSLIGHAFGPIDENFGNKQNYWELMLPLGAVDKPPDKLLFAGRIKE